MFKVKPRYTLVENLLEVWPTDPWSRKLIIKCMSRYNIGYKYVQTTMGTMALQFWNKEDYNMAIGLINDLEGEQSE